MRVISSWSAFGHNRDSRCYFGLSIEDLDLEKNEVSVQRQIKVRNGNKLILGLPKGRKTRTVPLPSVVLEAINEHVSAHPPRAVTLPWDKLDDPKHTRTSGVRPKLRSASNSGARTDATPFGTSTSARCSTQASPSRR